MNRSTRNGVQSLGTTRKTERQMAQEDLQRLADEPEKSRKTCERAAEDLRRHAEDFVTATANLRRTLEVLQRPAENFGTSEEEQAVALATLSMLHLPNQAHPRRYCRGLMGSARRQRPGTVSAATLVFL
jgi:hypothetical protein